MKTKKIQGKRKLVVRFPKILILSTHNSYEKLKRILDSEIAKHEGNIILRFQ